MAESLMTKNVQDGRDVLDELFVKMYGSSSIEIISTKRESSDIVKRMDSTLVKVIEQRKQAKGLPLVLRKRLMYERSLLN